MTINFDDERFQKVLSAKDFGQRLKAFRLYRGIGVSEIADGLGIHRSTFAGYETQGKLPPIDKLSRIAIALGTSVDFLVGLTDDHVPIDVDKNLVNFLHETKGLHWNGVPLTEEHLKPLADLFEIIVREKVKSLPPENDEQAAAK